MKANKQLITLKPGESRELVVVQDQPGLVVPEAEWKISLPAGASLNMVFVSLRGAEIHNRIEVALTGEGASCDLSGLYLADGTQQMEYDIRMDHLVPGCRSNQLFKGVIAGSAVTRFNGLIKVVPDAQKTEAYQANHNLLLSETARAFTRPQLEIYADDVKCSHGATIGRLDENELFYMRSRGIPEAEARLLQQLAFVQEVLDKIAAPEERGSLQERVGQRLRETASTLSE